MNNLYGFNEEDIQVLRSQRNGLQHTVRATESWGYNEDIQLWTRSEGDDEEVSEELTSEVVFAKSLVALVAEHGPAIGASLGMLEAKMLGLDISLEVLHGAISEIFDGGEEEEGEGDGLIGCQVTDLLTQLSSEEDDLLF